MAAALGRESFNPDKLDTFWSFICERQMIWKRRFSDKASPPWTKDIVLQLNRFTNVYRELDPGTIYAKEEILETQNSPKSKAFNIMFYRLIGEKETHRAVGFLDPDRFDASAVMSAMRSIRSSGGRVFTGAYLVAPYSNEGQRDKISNIAALFRRISSNFSSTWESLSSAGSAEEAYRIIRKVDGFGDFLAYQVLVDLLYPLRCLGGKPLLPFSNDDFVVPGPGARRGITMLIKDKSKNRADIDGASVVRWLHDNQRAEFARLGISFPYLKGKAAVEIPISLANMQNCLCEFHKYVKISEGAGRARRRFAYSSNAPD